MLCEYGFSAAGFLLLFAAELFRFRRRPRFSVPAARTGYILIGFSLAAAAYGSGASSGSPVNFPAGLILALVSAALLVYSVFIEIPLLKRKLNITGNLAVTSGTYGFCRHPGFLWLSLLLAGIVLMRGPGAVPYAIVTVVLNFLLVLSQDRIFFPEFFSNYGEYRRNVPFLVPFRWEP